MTKNSSGWKDWDGEEERAAEVGGARLVSLVEKSAGFYHVPAGREMPTSGEGVRKGLVCMYEAAICTETLRTTSNQKAGRPALQK